MSVSQGLPTAPLRVQVDRAEVALVVQTSTTTSQPKPDGTQGCPSAGSFPQIPVAPGGSVKMQIVPIAHWVVPLTESQGCPAAIFAVQVGVAPAASLQYVPATQDVGDAEQSPPIPTGETFGAQTPRQHVVTPVQLLLSQLAETHS